MTLGLSKFVLGALVFFRSSVMAQTIPVTWRKPTMTIPGSERILRAGAAIDHRFSAISNPEDLQSEDWLGIAQLCIEMADFDIFTGQQDYKQILRKLIPAAERVYPGYAYLFVRGGIAYGNAAIRAYEAYEDEIFLEYAIKAWNWGRQFTISDEDVEAGAIPTKSFTLQKTCNSTSITGGTFGLNSTDSLDLDSWATGNMLVLSVSFYRITSNETYLSSARAIANFIRTHLYVGSGLVVSQLSAGQDDGCQLDQATPAYGTGLFLQGLSLLNALAPSTAYDELIADIVESESLNTQWNDGYGVLLNTDLSGLYIPRGLLQVYNASADADLRSYISAYLSTQYNAVVDNALLPGTQDIYTAAWTGTSEIPVNSDETAQSMAISALLAGIPLLDNSVTSTVPSITPVFPSSSSSTSAFPSSSTPVGLIIGGAIGGFVIILLIILVLVYRRQRRQLSHLRVTPFDATYGNNSFSTSTRAVSTTDYSAKTGSPSSAKPYADFLSRQRIYRSGRQADDKRREKDASTIGPPPDYTSHWGP